MAVHRPVIAAQEANARHLSRFLTTWIDDDGMLVLRGRLTPEIGAAVHRVLEAAADQLRRECKEAPETGLVAEVTWGQRCADALGRLVEVALTAGLEAGHAGDRYHVVLHVVATADADAAASRATGPPTASSRSRTRRSVFPRKRGRSSTSGARRAR